jgi:predicted MFS family arabinose efflux permease
MWFPRGLGSAMGWLIGALVIGSASSHALRAAGAQWPWHSVFYAVAACAAAGGVLLYAALPETPRAAAPGRLQWRALASIWTDVRVRASAFGYFGHMWELYTMWVLVPVILATRLAAGATLSWAAFGVLAVGAIGCVAGGALARRIGSARVAAVQVATSGICCLLAPWLLGAPDVIFALWLFVWGVTVAGDSPQFSALTATNAPPHAVGSVLTLVNTIGFGISIVSIQLFVWLAQSVPLGSLLPWIGVGPLLGFWALRPLWRAR